jgi:hypothetical protein
MALTITKAKPKSSFEYTPISQKGEDKPFTVLFDALPLDVLASLQDDAIKVSQDGGYNVSINTLNYAVIKTALTGWENVEAADGPVRFKRDHNGVTDGTLSLIPGDIRTELATIIVEVSKDLPNAEEYLSELDKLTDEELEDQEQEQEVEVKETKKPTRKARSK